MPKHHVTADACVDQVLSTVGKRLVVALPLGLGKPNRFINALYARAKQDPSIDLEILTALTLQRPRPVGELERRFVGPMAERLFDGYIDLDFVADRARDALPDNVRVCEFFLLTGAFLGNDGAQQDYISANYTHAAKVILDRGANVLAQLVSACDEDGQTRYSLSCNPDISLDIRPMLDACRAEGRALAIVGEVNRELPFMVHDAEVPGEWFDHLIDVPGGDFPLFGVPHEPVVEADYAIAFHAAGLVRDGGTIQIGIGALGTAICHALALRQTDNAVFRDTLTALTVDRSRAVEAHAFDEGLYASSEMLVEDKHTKTFHHMLECFQ